mgnify:CR=1 FL=1
MLPLGAILDIGSKILDKVFPDPAQAEAGRAGRESLGRCGLGHLGGAMRAHEGPASENGGYFTLAPTTVSHCLVMTSFEAFC